MDIETQKREFINKLKDCSDADLADIALHIWVEQQERLYADQVSHIQTATDLSLSKNL